MDLIFYGIMGTYGFIVLTLLVGTLLDFNEGGN